MFGNSTPVPQCLCCLATRLAGQARPGLGRPGAGLCHCGRVRNVPGAGGLSREKLPTRVAPRPAGPSRAGLG